RPARPGGPGQQGHRRPAGARGPDFDVHAQHRDRDRPGPRTPQDYPVPAPRRRRGRSHPRPAGGDRVRLLLDHDGAGPAAVLRLRRFPQRPGVALHRYTMPGERLLIVDDERPVAESLQRLLQADGYTVDVATSAADARSLLGRVIYDLAVLDLRMPDVSGIDLLALCREIDPAIATLMLTAYGTVEAAVQSFQLGAKDFLTKPVRHEELLAAVERALALSRMTREARTLRQHFLDSVPFQAILGRTPELQRQLQLAADAAPSDISVVILGETGTGKGMVARAIHGASRRAGQPLVRAGIAGRSPALLD